MDYSFFFSVLGEKKGYIQHAHKGSVDVKTLGSMSAHAINMRIHNTTNQQADLAITYSRPKQSNFVQ